MRTTSIVALVFTVLFFLVPAAHAVDITVCASGCDYDTIAGGVAAASPGDTVLVGDGTYHESVSIAGITLKSLNGPDATTITGDDAANIMYVEDGASLEGFTLTGGYSNYGSAIRCESADPPVVVSDCIITGNEAILEGGGALYLEGCSMTIRNTTISDNTSAGPGGGILVWNNSTLNIVDSVMNGNSSAAAGGALCSYEGSSTLNIVRSRIQGNSAFTGGGLHVSASTSLALSDSLIAGNYVPAGSEGGGVFANLSTITLNHTTVTGNRGHNGGGLCLLAAPATITNSIVWGNGGDEGDLDVNIYWDSDQPDVSYSDAGGWTLGTNCIDADPLFADPRTPDLAPTVEGDYLLMTGSPCIDAADPLLGTLSDLDAVLRYRGSGYDMGAFEYDNDSFEDGPRLPALWTGRKLGDKDRRTSRSAYDGAFSFRMAGELKNKSLVQTVNVPGGQAGDVITLEGWSRAKGTNPAGGPCRLEMKLFYENGTTEVARAGFTKGPHAWQLKSATRTAAAAYTKVVVTLRLKNQTGTVFFDGISLTGERP